jgi:hypothetical protein
MCYEINLKMKEIKIEAKVRNKYTNGKFVTIKEEKRLRRLKKLKRILCIKK